VFAWLVTPVKLYAMHEAAFREDSADSKQALAVRKLADDPQSRLIIYCKSFPGVHIVLGSLHPSN